MDVALLSVSKFCSEAELKPEIDLLSLLAFLK